MLNSAYPRHRFSAPVLTEPALDASGEPMTETSCASASGRSLGTPRAALIGDVWLELNGKARKGRWPRLSYYSFRGARPGHESSRMKQIRIEL